MAVLFACALCMCALHSLRAVCAVAASRTWQLVAAAGPGSVGLTHLVPAAAKGWLQPRASEREREL